MIVADSSVIVAAVSSWHTRHVDADSALPPAAVGHALVESYSVLTRLPEPMRVDRILAAEVLRSRIHDVLTLSADDTLSVPQKLSELGIGGGATYDALIALTALAHDATLLTLDERAAINYRRCGVTFQLL